MLFSIQERRKEELWLIPPDLCHLDKSFLNILKVIYVPVGWNIFARHGKDRIRNFDYKRRIVGISNHTVEKQFFESFNMPNFSACKIYFLVLSSFEQQFSVPVCLAAFFCLRSSFSVCLTVLSMENIDKMSKAIVSFHKLKN